MPEPSPHERPVLPAHRDRFDDPGPTQSGRSWAGIVGLVLVAGALVLIVLAHLAGAVGPGAH